jgi:hypothetical protein
MRLPVWFVARIGVGTGGVNLQQCGVPESEIVPRRFAMAASESTMTATDD